MIRFLGFIICAGLVLLTGRAEAALLLAQSDWAVRKVQAETPYCTLSRNYDKGMTVTIARNAKGEGTIAFDFQRNAFELARPYPITLTAGHAKRDYAVKAATPQKMIMRTGLDQSLFQAMINQPQLDITIDDEQFNLDLSGYQSAFAEIHACLGVQQPQMDSTLPSEYVETKIPRAPVMVNAMADTKGSEIQALLEENRRLTQMLDEGMQDSVGVEEMAMAKKLADAEKRNLQLVRRVVDLEREVEASRASVNPSAIADIKNKDQQIMLLTKQNNDLRRALEDDGTPASQIELRLAEAETQAMAFKAERDEYRRLLQTERQRQKEMGSLGAKVEGVSVESHNLIADIQRLEADKVELIRQLEFVKSGGDPNVASNAGTQMIDDLTKRLDNMKGQLNALSMEKQSLEMKLAEAEDQSRDARKKMADMAIENLSSDAPSTLPRDVELQTLRAEIAALEAQNLMLRGDRSNRAGEIATRERQEKQRYEKRMNAMEAENARLMQELALVKDYKDPVAVQASNQNNGQKKSLPMAQDPQQLAQNSQAAAPKQQPMVQPLSGAFVKRLIETAAIPLASNVQRIGSASGPNFAAFQWDTGAVFGSGEQSRIMSETDFKASIQDYIGKTQQRCTGSFDQTVIPVAAPSGVSAQVADIACVMGNGGAAASILFVNYNNMFYAIAHEAGIDQFQTAMAMRDRVSGALSKAVF